MIKHHIYVQIPKAAVGTLRPIKPAKKWLDEYTGSERRTLAYNVAREIHWAHKRFTDHSEMQALYLPVFARTKTIQEVFMDELDDALVRMPEDYPGPPPPLVVKGSKKEEGEA